MRIGVDTRVLKIAVGGVWVYFSNLLKALQQSANGNKITTYDFKESELTKDKLAELDIFHCSDVTLVKAHGVQSVLPITDISTRTHPEFHHEGNIAHHNNKIHRFAVEEADHIIAISEFTKGELIRHLGIPESRITVIYPGVSGAFRCIENRDSIKPVLKRFGIQEGKYLLYVGLLQPRKNLIRLVNAFSNLTSELKGYKLVLAGQPAWKCEELFKAIEESPARPNIIVTGKISEDDLVYLYNGAKLFLYVSLYEGFGFPILEAMRCGIPVITSNNSSLPEIAGDSALLVDPTSIEELKSAIRQILDDSSLAETLRERGFAQARQFTWERTANKSWQLFKSISSRKEMRNMKKCTYCRSANITLTCENAVFTTSVGSDCVISPKHGDEVYDTYSCNNCGKPFHIIRRIA